MACRSLAKDFHRLLKRIGPLTDGQASIDSVDWDNDVLTNFDVTIRPNAGAYKLGRFKFTVAIPDEYLSGAVPIIRCNTQLPHPNIDPWNEDDTNVCLNLFEHKTWTPSIGLEGIVLGLLFLMHNPNFDSVLCEEFPDIFEEGFEEGIKTYMATGEVDGYEYDMDFRVIDGKFVDLNKESDKQIQECDSNTESGFTKAENTLKCPNMDDIIDGDVINTEINPVRFVKIENNEDGHGNFFYTTFSPEDTDCHLGKGMNMNGESTSESDDSSSEVNNIANDQEEMESDDINSVAYQLPDTANETDKLESECVKECEMDCSENTDVNENTFLIDNVVQPLQRTVTVFDLSESGFRTFMSRSASLPTHFQLSNFQPTFLTTA